MPKTQTKRFRRTNAQLHMDHLKTAAHYFAQRESEFDAGIDDHTFELLMFLVLGFYPSREALNATVQTSTPDAENT